MPPVSLRVLLTLAWPVILARATQSVIGFSDVLMVSRLGKDALAAAGSGSMNVFAVAILPMGTAYIVQSFAAQLAGRGEQRAARRYAWYGLMLAAAAGLLALCALPFVPWAISRFKYTPAVASLMSDYMVLRLTAVMAIVGTEVLGNWYGGLGNTRLQMVAGVVAMVSNVVLNWVLIYGHLGAPAMGVSGAALASSLASWAGFAVCTFVFLRRGPGDPRARGPLGLRWREMARMLRFGLPNGANWFLEFAAFALFLNVIMPHLGTAAVAGLQVVIQLNSVAFMPAFGVATAGAILVGQTVGAGHKDRVWPIVRLAVATAMAWMGTLGLVYLLAPDALMSLFAWEQEPAQVAELLRVGASMLAMSAAWQAFDAIAMTFSESLRAAGDTAWTLGARIVLAWLVFVPASYVYVIRLGGGAVAAMGCLILYLALLAATLAWRFGSGAWKRIELIEPQVLPD